MLQESEIQIRTQFFDTIFGEDHGWVCIATKEPNRPNSSFRQNFFEWPDNFSKIEEFIVLNSPTKDIYFCVNLLKAAKRKKENCLPTNVLWADLDEVNPSNLKIIPPVQIESSPGRFQALWRLSVKLDPWLAEEYSKRIAYSTGADKSGWDLTQLLRVPFTTNFKYSERPTVMLLQAASTTLAPLLFEMLPQVEIEHDNEISIPDIPKLEELVDPASILYKFSTKTKKAAFTAVYTQTPGEQQDWSKTLWKLIHMCLEMGMDEYEVFSVARSSPCNKYGRDNRPQSHLWREVIKAKRSQEKILFLTKDFTPLSMPQLVDEPASETFIETYRDWAEEATDAIPEFHDLCAAIMLSCVASNSVRLETSYGPMAPNLWGMILGDSTLSRKTTAMQMVMNILQTIDPDMVLATDGSAEGLLTGLETRPNRTSLFFRDELSGFFDSINRKDYLAGMPETLTALYDVPPIYQRRLRKEIIRIESPIFIFLGGGVKDKIYETLREEYVLSGFLPRFLVVTGNTDVDKLRRTGPANDIGIAKRTKIVDFVAEMYENYAMEVTMNIGGQKMKMPPRIMAKLTNDAWDTYGEFEETVVRAAQSSSIPSLALPTFERLSRSLLKLSLCLASSRQAPTEEEIILVEKDDVINSAWYIQNWGRYSVELIMNTGKGFTERLLDKIVRVVEEHPGILKSQLMQHYHLSKKEANEILGTLEERMLIRREQQGNGWRFYAS